MQHTIEVKPARAGRFQEVVIEDGSRLALQEDVLAMLLGTSRAGLYSLRVEPIEGPTENDDRVPDEPSPHGRLLHCERRLRFVDERLERLRAGFLLEDAEYKASAIGHTLRRLARALDPKAEEHHK